MVFRIFYNKFLLMYKIESTFCWFYILFLGHSGQRILAHLHQSNAISYRVLVRIGQINYIVINV